MNGLAKDGFLTNPKSRGENAEPGYNSVLLWTRDCLKTYEINAFYTFHELPLHCGRDITASLFHWHQVHAVRTASSNICNVYLYLHKVPLPHLHL